MGKKSATMDRRHKSMLVSILLILLLIVFLAGYTFAKYISTYQIIGRANIAKWNFVVNGNTTSNSEVILLTDTRNEIDVADGIIAPGTSGEFEIELDATDSDVDVQYAISILNEQGNKPKNLTFSVYKNGVTNGTKYSTMTQLASSELTGIIRKKTNEENSNTQKEKFKIVWEWPYELLSGSDKQKSDYDVDDTDAGLGKTDDAENVFDYSFSLSVVGTQAKA